MFNFKTKTKNLLYLINKNPISKALYKKDIQKRAKLAVTEIDALSKNINIFSPYTNEIQPVNDWYSHASILKNFLGLPQNYQFKSIIEHGLYLSKQVADIELESNLPSFITYSPYRVKVLRKYRKYAAAIGPFIHYASHYLTQEELKKEKRRLGKTLLFFPSHSLVGLTTYYDQDWSYRKIMPLAKNFDTIRVCVYWKDILLNKHKYYEEKGFECVTAGHMLDPCFLSRVKSIIYTADLTVSNDASSPLSYCIYMKKPHIIFYQRPYMRGKKYLKDIITDFWKSEPYNEIIKEFSKVKFEITPKQQALMNYYCGTESVKTKKELLKIIRKTEEIFKN